MANISILKALYFPKTLCAALCTCPLIIYKIYKKKEVTLAATTSFSSSSSSQRRVPHGWSQGKSVVGAHLPKYKTPQ